MMEVSYKIIQHKYLNRESLDQICALKDSIWSYGMEGQRDWISKNIREEDFHLMLYGDRLIGYTNIVCRKISLDTFNQMELLGIGNVCISLSHQNKGLGFQLLKIVSEFLTKKNKSGALLCKNSLVDFYLRNNWVLVDSQKYGAKLKAIKSNLMTYNLEIDFKTIELLSPSF